MNKKLLLLVSVLLVAVVVGGCSSSGTGGTGDLALSIADAPVNDIKHVYVTLNEVKVHSNEQGWSTINNFSDDPNGEKKVDLLALRFDDELLGQKTLPEGTYNQIRLIVAAKEEGTKPSGTGGINPTELGKSYIVYENDDTENIFIPSGVQTGLKINHNFTIQDGVIKRLVLDNDVSKILKNAGNSGKIILRPTAIEVIDKVISGNIEGIVLGDEDGNGTIDDLDGDGNLDEAITSYDVTIEALDSDGNVVKSTVAITEAMDSREAGSFLLRGLKEGTYTINAYAEDTNDNVKYQLPVDRQPGGSNEITVDVTAESTVNLTDLYGKLKLEAK